MPGAIPDNHIVFLRDAQVKERFWFLRGSGHESTLPNVSTLSDTERMAGIEPSGDVELLTRLSVAADRASFLTLYDRHVGAVFAYAITRLNSREDAEEITQDAFITLWRKRTRLRLSGTSALPWLIVTCRNLAANRGRAVVAASQHIGDDDALELVAAADSGSPEVQVELVEVKAVIDQAIAGLGELDQAILHACLIDGYSYDEAATNLGTSNAVVRNRLSRLKARLRDELSTLKGAR